MQLNIGRGSKLGVLSFTIARVTRLASLATAEELLYRSVIYTWLEQILYGMEGTWSGDTTLSILPTMLSAALFGMTFKSYQYEFLVGVTVGILLQVCCVWTASLLPSIVAHTVMEIVLDAYRRRRRVPKPSSGVILETGVAKIN